MLKAVGVLDELQSFFCLYRVVKREQSFWYVHVEVSRSSWMKSERDRRHGISHPRGGSDNPAIIVSWLWGFLWPVLFTRSMGTGCVFTTRAICRWRRKGRSRRRHRTLDASLTPVKPWLGSHWIAAPWTKYYGRYGGRDARNCVSVSLAKRARWQRIPEGHQTTASIERCTVNLRLRKWAITHYQPHPCYTWASPYRVQRREVEVLVSVCGEVEARRHSCETVQLIPNFVTAAEKTARGCHLPCLSTDADRREVTRVTESEQENVCAQC